MNRIITNTTRQIETDNGHKLDLPFSDPYDNTIIEDTLILKNAGNENPTFGGYLTHDADAYDSYEFPEGCTLTPMSSRERECWMQSVWEDDGEYELASTQRLVRANEQRGSIDFDIIDIDQIHTATDILDLADDIPETHRDSYAEGILAEYSEVCSGNSYAIVLCGWDHDGKETNSSIIGGYHGLDSAQTELALDLKAENEYTYR
jgi:hypothetical protein